MKNDWDHCYSDGEYVSLRIRYKGEKALWPYFELICDQIVQVAYLVTRKEAIGNR